MAERSFFAVSTLLWLGYGVYCFFQPGVLAEMAGVMGSTPTATTELRAMYGGAQAGIGLLCAGAFAQATLRRPALLALLFIVGGLGTTRLLGALLDGSFTSYTFSGLGFEWATIAVAAWLLSRTSTPPAATFSS
ncbi:MAG: DUF4345 family protein [Deltaproteobacteria bacterium]|nr:DUF4345 family protein [Deltaproteobacteria bacterium]MBW2360007.1 DUF4345 family protein [Deltaproteobacteria bacterium]